MGFGRPCGAMETAALVGARIEELARLAGLEQAGVVVSSTTPVLPGVHRVDVAAAAVVGAVTAAVAEVAHERTGRRPAAAVSGRAAQLSFRSERYLRIDGASPPDPWAALSGDHRSADG